MLAGRLRRLRNLGQRNKGEHVELGYNARLDALQAAGKHVFVEKPLAPSSALADDLAQLAASRRLTLMCGHTFIYSPPVRAVKRMLESGTLGEVYFISSSRVNLGLHQRDVSVIWDLGPHDFSILLYWLSELPSSVRAVGRDSIVKGIADVAFITMNFPSGIVVNVELSWLAPSKLRRTVVVGSERMVIYDDGAAEPVRLFDSGVVYRDPETFGEYHLSYRSGDILSPRIETHEPLVLELGDFVRSSLRGERMGFHTSLARSVVRMVEAADRSLIAGGPRGHARSRRHRRSAGHPPRARARVGHRPARQLWAAMASSAATASGANATHCHIGACKSDTKLMNFM